MRLHAHVLLVVTLLWVVPRTVLGQTTPPTVSFTSPPGLQQGTTGTFVIEGTDLQGASAIVFSEPGVSGKILEVGPVPESKLALETKAAVIAKPYFQDPLKMEAKVELTAEKWVAAGTHQFRIITPHGSSTLGKFVVGAFPELEEHEPNDKRFHSKCWRRGPISVPGILRTGNGSASGRGRTGLIFGPGRRDLRF